MALFAAIFHEIFGGILLLRWIAPPLILLAAYVIYIIVKTVQEFRK